LVTGVHAYDRSDRNIEVRLATVGRSTRRAGDRKNYTAAFNRNQSGSSDTRRLRHQRLFLQQHYFMAQSSTPKSREAILEWCLNVCSAMAGAQAAHGTDEAQRSILDSVMEEVSGSTKC